VALPLTLDSFFWILGRVAGLSSFAALSMRGRTSFAEHSEASISTWSFEVK